MLELPAPPGVNHMEFATHLVTELPTPPELTWEGYVNQKAARPAPETSSESIRRCSASPVS